MRRNSVHRSLQAPYDVPFSMLKRGGNFFFNQYERKAFHYLHEMRVNAAFITDSNITPRVTKFSPGTETKMTHYQLIPAVTSTSLIISYNHDNTGRGVSGDNI
ncbi:hypothetical protein NPIL_362731 [Nephila pilipes]|uniref:Uncharacterized protein n=1 Tax=Nephila pilipes TaxID=299642 RepID=A0A8X6TTM8_NEPPI|nr:hypothetical protein NPIL_362731 [Nephila pilipes]